MKILCVSCKDYNFYNFRSELLLKLQEAYKDVVLVCPYGAKINYFTERGFRFINLDLDRRGANVFRDLKLIRNYIRLFKEEKPDLVLTFTTKPSLYAAYACKKLIIPCIVNNAGLSDNGWLINTIMKVLFKVCENKADCLMYQNSFERDYIQNLLKNKTHFRDLPGSGVNLSKFVYREYPSEECGKIIFNYVGRLVELKGIDEYLECARRIKAKYQNVEFRIFGEFDDEKYKPIVKALEKEGVVKYFGPQLDMTVWIAECNAVIHPSHYEGMTNVVLEHSAMGRPCIGSNIPGVLEGIDDAETGFVFEVKNVDSLVDAVDKFLKLSYQEKKEMGFKARAKMEREFSRDIVTNIYLSEIERIMGEKNGL